MPTKKQIVVPVEDKPFFLIEDGVKGYVRNRFIQILQAWYPTTINYKNGLRAIKKIAPIIASESGYALNRLWIEEYLRDSFTKWWDKRGFSRDKEVRNV